MRKFCFIYLLSVLPSLLPAQPVCILWDTASQPATHYAVLPDRGYTISQVTGENSLPFMADNLLWPKKHKAYWLRIKIANTSPYSQQYYVEVMPDLVNTLYYRHAGTGQWLQAPGGILQPANDNVYKGRMLCKQQAKDTSTLYIKVSLPGLGNLSGAIKPQITLTKWETGLQREQQILSVWRTCFALLMLNLLNYLYVYRSFKEKSILYYLVAQLGGMLYVTSYWFVLYKWFPVKLFTLSISNGRIYSYDANFLLNHLSVVLILYGLVQLTRNFLSTASRLPKLDAVLKYSLYGYILFAAAVAIINTMVVQVNHLTLPFDNFFCLVVILAMLTTCVVGYTRRFAAAGPFLFANLLPFVFLAAIAFIHVFTQLGITASWLPLLAIMAQSLGYSIALVALMKHLRQRLQQKEQEARQLVSDIQEIDYRQRILTLENRQIQSDILLEKSKNEALQEKLEENQRELASTSLYLMQKNEMLATLKKEVQGLGSQYPDKELEGISSILQSNLLLDSDWERFKVHFEQVHPRFFEELQVKHPTLTRYETRLYAYLHINLSTKEIAALLNIDPASVRQAKMRLQKKLSPLKVGSVS